MIRRVITDRDVMLGTVTPPIVLDEHTLLTPAARDRAVQKGWAILERGAALPPDPRSASAGARGAGPGSSTAAGDASPTSRCAHCGATPCTCAAVTCAGCGASPCACRADASDGGACAAATSTAAGHGAARLGALPDGLHLVRVQGGRVVSALPAAGPGLLQPARGQQPP